MGFIPRPDKYMLVSLTNCYWENRWEKTRIKCTTEDLTDSESGTDSDSHSENNDGNELDPKRNDEIWYQKYVWFFSYM